MRGRGDKEIDVMSVQQLRSDKRVQIPATAVTIGLMLLFPFIVHAIGGPAAGGRWLPLFYAPLVAALLFHPLVAVVAGLVTPFLNHALTGAPPLNTAVLLSVELVVFSLVMQGLARRWPAFWGAAPLAYLAAKVGSLLLVVLLPSLMPVPAWQFFSTSLINALPGMAVLLLINWLTVRGMQRGR
jgi:hypothetical protein